ncbi:hypothetical protein NDU88_005849, partial [Pleurodeles waltl]
WWLSSWFLGASAVAAELSSAVRSGCVCGRRARMGAAKAAQEENSGCSCTGEPGAEASAWRWRKRGFGYSRASGLRS